MSKSKPQPRAIKPKKGKCSICGKEYLYVRKEQGLCLACQAATKQSPASRWRSERLLFAILKILFKDYEFVLNGYYSFLSSPKGQPMQLDWYCPELKLAFELQGEQHYKQVKYFQKDKKAHTYQQDCDRLKRQTCSNKNIHLIEVKTTGPLDRDFILDKIRQEAPSVYLRIKDNNV